MLARAQAEALVILVFNAGASALDSKRSERKSLADQLVLQLRMVATGAEALQHKIDNRA